MHDQPAALARRIIAKNRYMTVATSDSNGPWVAPVAYAADPNYHFYFYSAVDSLHSRHIARSPHVALAIFDSTAPSDLADGLQIAAVASVVADRDLQQVVELYFSQSFPNPTDREKWIRPASHFRGDAIQRFYCATPERIYKLDLTTLEVDRRIEIRLEEMQGYLDR